MVVVYLICLVASVVSLIICGAVYFRLQKDLAECRDWINRMDIRSQEDHAIYANALYAWEESMVSGRKIRAEKQATDERLNEMEERIKNLTQMM